MAPEETPPDPSEEQPSAVSRDPVANLRRMLRNLPRPRWREKREGVFWQVIALFSLAINLVLIVFLILVGSQVFKLKQSVAEPLLRGVSSSMADLNRAHLRAEVTVREEIPLDFEVPIQHETMVALAQPAQISGATLSIQSGGFSFAGPAYLELPVGTELPIKLDLNVPVSAIVPVELNVPVDIPLAESELHPTLTALQQLVNPYRDLLTEAPDCWQMMLWDGTCP